MAGASKSVAVEIKAPNLRTIAMTIEGTAPYVQNKFSQKALQEMLASHVESAPSGVRKARKPKNVKELYEGAQHKTKQGWCGIPAPAFRCAMISACRTINFTMTKAKLACFVESDGVDESDGTPLVKITKGAPRQVEHMVRNSNGQPDIRPRPMWDMGWQAIVRVTYDADMFRQADIVNLFARSGLQVGVGEGRPDSKNSAGMGWGTFRILSEKEMEPRKGAHAKIVKGHDARGPSVSTTKTRRGRVVV